MFTEKTIGLEYFVSSSIAFVKYLSGFFPKIAKVKAILNKNNNEVELVFSSTNKEISELQIKDFKRTGLNFFNSHINNFPHMSPTSVSESGNLSNYQQEFIFKIKFENVISF